MCFIINSVSDGGYILILLIVIVVVFQWFDNLLQRRVVHQCHWYKEGRAERCTRIDTCCRYLEIDFDLIEILVIVLYIQVQ